VSSPKKSSNVSSIVTYGNASRDQSIAGISLAEPMEEERYLSFTKIEEKVSYVLSLPMISLQRLEGNMAKGSKQALKRIPAFRSQDEEARWYAAHREDLHKYIAMDDAEVVEPDPTADRGGMTQVVSLRLPRRLLTDLRRVAEQLEISYQLLIKRWLSDRLAQETATPNSRRSSGRRKRAA
jgi:CopG antitoxin of type II toxin-antitoxin system